MLKTKTIDELIHLYAQLVNITRTKRQEIEMQSIIFELELRANLKKT